MTLDHRRLEELMAVDALGALDGDDRALLERERSAHGDCAECRALEFEFAETAGSLALALPPLPVDETVVDAILATPRGEVVDLRMHERRRRRWQALVAVAAAIAVVVVATIVTPSTTSVNDVSVAQRVVTFSGSADGELAMAYTPGEPGAVFWGRLPTLSPDEVYEIWMIEEGEATSGGCVSATDGVVAFGLDADIGTADTMAVTTEATACPDAPTSDPILVADLPTTA
jgi:anti-sigma-K factor RskA